MSKIAIKRRFIALRKAGERERRQSFIRVARWSVCHLGYGHKLGHLGALTLLYLVTIEPVEDSNVQVGLSAPHRICIVGKPTHLATEHVCWAPEYHILRAVVLSNEQKVYENGGITYLPIYYCMFFENNRVDNEEDLVIPWIEMPDFWWDMVWG